MGSPPYATTPLSFIRDTIQNVLSRVQGSLQEEVKVAGNPNTVSSKSEPSFMDLADRTINDLLMQLYRMGRIDMENFEPSTTNK